MGNLAIEQYMPIHDIRLKNAPKKTMVPLLGASFFEMYC